MQSSLEKGQNQAEQQLDWEQHVKFFALSTGASLCCGEKLRKHCVLYHSHCCCDYVHVRF